MIGVIVVAYWLTFVAGQQNICSETPSVTQHCPEDSNGWYFNVERNKCKKFKSGRCTTDSNQFSTKAECKKLCMVHRNFRTNRQMPGLPSISWKDVCLTEMKWEDCRLNSNASSIWFFNSSAGICQQCNFGGKPGFKNKFAEFRECKWACVNILAQWNVRSCYDCDSPTSYCSQDETSSTRTCHCRRGFDRRRGSNNCEDVNECDQALFHLCHENGECVNTVGSYYCRCKENYFGDGKTYCHPSDPVMPSGSGFKNATQCRTTTKEECEKRSITCAPEAVCLHAEENYFCQCPDGYLGNGSYCISNGSLPERADRRDCASNDLFCDTSATCFHFGPKYFCQCAHGYFGNGTICALVPTPEPMMIDSLYCQRNNKWCSPNANCFHQSPSNYLCICKPGYSGDGVYCERLTVTTPVKAELTDNEMCLRNGITCSRHATCKIAASSYFCECSFGYAGNGVHCTTDQTSCLDTFDKHYLNQCGSYNFQKWFYFDHDQRFCKMFWFGKCAENIHSRNIFADERTCNDFCYKHFKVGKNTMFHEKLITVTTMPRPAWYKTSPQISTVPSFKVNQTKIPKECLQPCQSGSCSSTMVMYFYNGQSGQCQPFLYSGCGGNKNRFYSLAFCETACLSPYLRDVEEICLLPLSQGYGKGDERCEHDARELYYYNPYSSDCEKFHFYGCGGNANHFHTYVECSIRCMRKVPMSVAILGTRNLRDCFLPKDEGRCEYIPTVNRTRYYYNADKRLCTAFQFSGCGGNENRFGEEDVCKNICGGLYKPKSNICIGWPDAGQCNDINVKWYFNMKTGKCQEFSWTGCAGNTNRFPSRQRCEEICLEKKN